MQNKVFSSNEYKFRKNVKRARRPVVRLDAKIIDYLTEQYRIETSIPNECGFDIVLGDNNSFDIQLGYVGRCHFIISYGDENDDRAILTSIFVEAVNILNKYDLVLDESLIYPRYIIEVDCTADSITDMTIMCDHIHTLEYSRGNIKIIAKRIQLLNMYRPNTSHIICPDIVTIRHCIQFKDVIEQQGRVYFDEQRALTLIGALYLNHQAKCSIIKQNM